MNSIVAPSKAEDFFASATRCSGVPCEPASPREQMTKCAERPRRVSFAMTAPQANSMSSGCAPKTRSGARSGEVGVGFIGAVDGVAIDVSDFGRIFRAQVSLLARARDVVRAVQQG